MGSDGIARTMNAVFLGFCLKHFWMAAGASGEYEDAAIDDLMFK